MSSDARVRCLPGGRVIEPEPDETLLAAALRRGIPLASSCGGRAVCGDCIVRVLAGAEHLAPPDENELAWRARGRGVRPGRLACCTSVRGPVDVSTTYW